jgi:glycosyltransferase involved in cell wall biosynthesis
MKICIISENILKDAIGGAEIQCKYIGYELLKRGHKVYYIYISNRRVNRFVEEGIVFEPIFVPSKILTLIRYIRPLQLIIEYFLLKRSMNKIRADIWYYRVVNTFLVALVKIKKSVGGKLIYALSMDMQARKEGWVTRYGEFYHKKFQESLQDVDYFIFQKESQKEEFFKNYNYSGEVIYNGHPFINTASNTDNRLNIKHKMKIIWVGNLKRMKQPELYFEIVAKLNHMDILFNMVGKSSNSYKDIVDKISVENENFKYRGQLKNHIVLELINSSDLTISTSDLNIQEDSSEGFPNVFIESWKYGVPIISLFDPDGLIKKYNVGIVCNNADEIVSTIKKLYNNPDILIELSENCKKLFEEKFSIEHNVGIMLDMLK